MKVPERFGFTRERNYAASESGRYNGRYDGKVCGLLYCYGLSQVAGLVDVAAAADGDVIGQKL